MSPVHLSLTVRVCLKYKTNVSIFLRNISLSKSLVSALYSKLYQDLVHYGVLKWKNELIKLKIISLSENFFSACLCLLLYEAPFILHCNHDHYGFLNWKNELIKTILHSARMNLVHCHQQHQNSSCARCVQDVRKMCTKCAQDVCKMCARCVQDVCKICARCVQVVLNMCARCVQGVRKMCARFAQYMCICHVWYHWTPRI